MATIGIMTYYAVQNFGAALQAFALQQNIERFGVKVEFLRFFDKHNESVGTSRRGSILSLLLYNKHLRNNLMHISRFIRVKRYIKPNNIGFTNFKSRYLHLSNEPYYEYEDLKLANQRYEGFVTGSDMVWTPIGQNLEAYFLQFADKEKRFSYAPSMTGCQTYTRENTEKIKQYLKEMNVISCREQEGIDFVKKNIGREATLVLDPTLLFSKEDWLNELNITSQIPSKPYILCYNFGGMSKKIKNEVYNIAKKRNMDVRYIPLSHEESYAELKLGHCGPYGPREFVELFLNASFVVTNTFHGFLFSLISEKPFVVIRRDNGNAWKANETRISNFMDILGIIDRYIESDTCIEERYLSLDYAEINELISSRRKESLYYLKAIVEQACKTRKVSQKAFSNVRDLSIKQCTGCTLCASICPFDAIKMVEDKEGFVVPLVDNEKCKECGKCAKSCPSIYPLEKRYPLNSVLCLSKDKQIENSASGGLFFTISKYFIEQLKGVVYGVVFDKEFNCFHKEATTIDELYPMQNSKYIQSNVGDCYNKAKQRLEEGRYVLFSGTPCQIAALKSYLKKDYTNLLTLDIVCHGVPNQKYWKTYITNLKKNGQILSYSFRNRANKKTWNPALGLSRRSTLEATIITSEGIKRLPALQDSFYGPFIRCESYRLSCYYCQYARKERVSDITMGDCDSDNLYPDFYPYESKSISLINTEKGKKVWDLVSDKYEFTKLDYMQEVRVNTTLGIPSTMPLIRKNIYQDLKELSWKDFESKYVNKPSYFLLLKAFIKKIIY